MIKVYFDVGTFTIGSDTLKVFHDHIDQSTTADYLEYDEDITRVTGSGSTAMLWTKVATTGGEVSTKIPTAPIDGEDFDLFNIQYDATNACWWKRIGA